MMSIGFLKLVIHIPNSSSLKDKRMILNSLTKRLRNCFNISVAQLDYHDKWQKSCLGVVSVCQDQRSLNRLLSGVCDYIRADGRLDILDYEIQMV